MAISETQSKEIELDLSGIPRSEWKQVKKEISDLVIDEILRFTADGQSPVAGESSFRKLNKDYAAREKQGNETPNLRLEGDLMDSLQGENSLNGVVIGVSIAEEEKSDGHNQLTGRDSHLPKRRFIPDENQNFKPSIMQKVNDILDNYRAGIESPTNPIELEGEIDTELKGSGERIRGLVETILRRR